jgi:nucleoside 2-deoxyribosyltransferase
LSDLVFATFLPQKDGFQQTELEKADGKTKSAEMIFKKDVQELKSSDVVVFNMDGRIMDEGTCVEIGIGYALGKECVGLKTDVKVAFDDTDNPMILEALQFRVVSMQQIFIWTALCTNLTIMKGHRSKTYVRQHGGHLRT